MSTRKEIRDNLGKLSPEERRKASKLLDKLDLDISEGDERLTGTKPGGFYLEGEFYHAEHHREIFLKVAEIVALKNPTQQDRFLEIFGRKRKYFSKDYRELSHDYRKINGTDIYAELNENAKTLNKRCEKIIIKFGLDLNSFKIT